MIIGHHKQWGFLKNSIENNRISHAYLFYGPTKIGKKTIALDFAKLLVNPASKSNIVSAIFKQIYGGELTDIDYEKTFDYGETVKPTIKG